MRRFFVVDDKFRKHSDEWITLPRRATRKACAYDFYSPCDCVVLPHSTLMIWTDVKAQMEDNEALIINVRSSMGKSRISLANTMGWIDADYYNNPNNNGNIGINLLNNSDTPYYIHKGDRIAQGMLINYLVTDDDDVTEDRIGGFGSTNK